MTQLTEHTKTILRAIADGKQIQYLGARGDWNDTSPELAVRNIFQEELRIKLEVRSINGVEFGAPVGPSEDAGWRITICADGPSRAFDFTEAKDRDTAYQAIVSALEGRTK